MYKRRALKNFSIFLIVLVSTLLTALSANANEDKFLYGVQIFNYPIDWDGGKYSALVQEMINKAADIGFDIIRGGSQFNNMYSQVNYDSEKDMWGLKKLLRMLKAKNMKLNWVITGVDYSIGMTNPPNINDWQKLTEMGANIVASIPNQPDVIYEIWNEPDCKDGNSIYWNGTCDYYYDTFFPAAFNSIRQNDSDAKIINGGLVLGNSAPDSMDYMTRAVRLLENGTISMLAIHAHDTLDEFLSKWQKENFSQKGVDVSKIFLNECGLSMEYNNGIVTYDNEIKSFHVAGKVMAAKKLGLGGIVVFHMGGLTESMMSSLKDNGHYYSYMLDYNNGALSPNQIYKAIETVIKYTKGLLPVFETGFWATEKHAEGYVWLFRSGDKVTIAAIGRTPTSEEINKAFPDGKYKRYDMYGVETQSEKTGSREITYFVSGFNNDNDKAETKGGGSGGGCSTGLWLKWWLAYIVPYFVYKKPPPLKKIFERFIIKIQP